MSYCYASVLKRDSLISFTKAREQINTSCDSDSLCTCEFKCIATGSYVTGHIKLLLKSSTKKDIEKESEREIEKVEDGNYGEKLKV